MAKQTKFNLKALRTNKGLIQKEVAKLLNVHYQTIRNWELGKVRPSEDQIENLCALYGVSRKLVDL